MEKKGISAALLEKILLFVIFLILAATIGIYTFLFGFVKTQAEDAAKSVAKAEASQKNIDDLNKSYKWLQENPDIVEKTNKIVADASKYQYQDQVILDLESYADQAGLKVSGYSFNEAATASTAPATGATSGAAATGSTATPSTSGTATGGGAAATPAAGTSATPSGLSTATIDITLDGSVSYRKLLMFMKKIEQNVTRMQISALNISPTGGEGSLPDAVTVDTFTISVFIKAGA